MRIAAWLLAPLVFLVALVAVSCLLGYGLLLLSGGGLGLDKLISKSTQLLLVLSIFPLRRWLGLSWADLGLPAGLGECCRQVGRGLLLALATLLPVLLLLYALDVHVFDAARQWTAGKIAEKIGLGLLLALLIAVFEEMLFRGLLLTSLRRRLGMLPAILVSSVYYAALHFLKSHSSVAFAAATPGSGFKLMAEAFGNWLNPEILGAFVSLFVVGAFLAVLRCRYPRGLGLCIGCHCGWVWQIKVDRDVLNLNPTADYLYLVSQYNEVVGPLVSVWLGAATLVLWWMGRGRQCA